MNGSAAQQTAFLPALSIQGDVQLSGIWRPKLNTRGALFLAGAARIFKERLLPGNLERVPTWANGILDVARNATDV